MQGDGVGLFGGWILGWWAQKSTDTVYDPAVLHRRGTILDN